MTCAAFPTQATSRRHPYEAARLIHGIGLTRVRLTDKSDSLPLSMDQVSRLACWLATLARALYSADRLRVRHASRARRLASTVRCGVPH